jgi:hypothetical protein
VHQLPLTAVALSGLETMTKYRLTAEKFAQAALRALNKQLVIVTVSEKCS